MGTRLHEVKLVAISVIVTLSIVGSPAIAHGVKHALFAHKAGTAKVANVAKVANNAKKVDGKDAVSSTSLNRANKLVATDAGGKLPNDIISLAPDADLLDGTDSSAFLRGTRQGTAAGFSPGFPLQWDVTGLGTFDLTCGNGSSSVTFTGETGTFPWRTYVDTGGTDPAFHSLNDPGTTTIGPVGISNADHQEWLFHPSTGSGLIEVVVTIDFAWEGLVPGGCLVYGQATFERSF